MFPGGGGMNDRKMQQMMKQMGIDMQELDAEEVVIRTPDEELVFTEADVQRMDAQGQQTYTIVGEPESRALGEGGADAGEGDADGGEGDADAGDAETGTEAGADAGEGGSADAGIPDEDVELVAQRAGVSEDDARDALETSDGDLAAAIAEFE